MRPQAPLIFVELETLGGALEWLAKRHATVLDRIARKPISDESDLVTLHLCAAEVYRRAVDDGASEDECALARAIQDAFFSAIHAFIGPRNLKTHNEEHARSAVTRARYYARKVEVTA